MNLTEILHDTGRLTALRNTALLDSPPEEAFDRLTRIAAAVLRAPLALVNLVDERRQFSKSCFAPASWPPEREAALADSFCKYTVVAGEPLLISDTRLDPRVATSGMVTELGVVSYAGVPLMTPDGHVIGTVCVADFEPREWSRDQIRLLEDLAAATITEIELRQEVRERRRAEAALRQREIGIHLLEMVTVAASESATLQEAMQTVVDYTCTRLGWPVGHAYALGEDGKLVPTAVWHLEEDELPQGAEVSHVLRLAAPEGLPGKVLRDRAAVWLEDVTAEPRFPAAGQMRKIGVRTGFAFPISLRNDVVGVMEFYSPRRISADEQLLQVVHFAGVQLGRVAERTRLEQDLSGHVEIARGMHTPLADLRDHLETLTRLLREAGDERMRHFVMLAVERVQRLKRIESKLEDLKISAAVRSSHERAPVDLALVVRNAVDAAQKEFGTREIHLEDSSGPLPVPYDGERMDDLVRALVANAINHSGADNIVKVELNRTGGAEVELRVQDEGLGLPPADLAKVLARYHELAHHDQAPNTSGGIGIQVTGGRVIASGGNITAGSAGGGTTFKVRLKLAES